MNTKKIVITGGPSTGKSSIINELSNLGYTCFEEISRQVTLDARKKGTDQLFLTNPLLFSELLLKGRETQYKDAKNAPLVFFDRGIPDVIAYMDYAKEASPTPFIKSCQDYRYDHIFILPPWKDIHKSDAVRYESFEQAETIHKSLLNTYNTFGYDLKKVPFGSVKERALFIINSVNTL